MATTKNLYTGDGSTTLFPFTFPYIAESDIVVTIDDVVQTIITEYIFSNATTIGFLTAPADGAVVLIKRVTSADVLKATFFPGSAIRARDLNDNFTQNLYVTQESEINAGDATEAARIATEAALQAQQDAAEAKEDAAAAAEDAQEAADAVAGAAQDAADAQVAASAAQEAAGSAQAAADQAAADAQTAVEAVDEILDAVEDGAVVSVNGQGGIVSLGIGDMTDVDTSSAGHTPSDGNALVWDEAMGHWMPGDSASNIVDQGDFAYAPASNTVVWDEGTNRTDGFILDPDDWRFLLKAFVWSPYNSNHSEMMKLEVGDEINFVLGGSSGTRTVTAAPNINAYDGPSGVNSPPTSYYIEVDIDWPPNTADELRLTSARFVQGVEPLRAGDILKYDTATGKWTASPSISIGTLPTLP